MTTTFPSAAFHTQREDLLALLPTSTVLKYRKDQVVYGPGRPSPFLYLVTAGTVRLSHMADDRHEIVLDLIRAGEVFGESGLLRVARVSERAAAHGDVNLMAWSVSAIEDLITRNPGLAVSLLHVLVQRAADFVHHIESLAMDNIERRLARSLIRFCERHGTPGEDGSIRMMPLSQELLAHHIGASREVISGHMNRFRRQGYLDYSRAGIVLYGKALAAWTTSKPPISGLSYSDRTSLSATAAL